MMVSESGVIFTDLYSVLFAALNSLWVLSQKGKVWLSPQLQILYLFHALSLIFISYSPVFGAPRRYRVHLHGGLPKKYGWHNVLFFLS